MTSLEHLMLTLQSLEACRKCPQNWVGDGKSFTNEQIAEALTKVVKIELDIFLLDVEKAVQKGS